MYRSSSYDEYLSKKLTNKRFAQEYLLSLIEDHDLTLDEALKQTISKMGIKEFSKMAHIAAPSLVRFIKGKGQLKPQTLDTFLKPFALRTKTILEKVA